MVGSFLEFKQKLISFSIFNIINRKTRKKKKRDRENVVIPKQTPPKTTPVITIKDIQECNRRQFGHLNSNGIVEIISYSNRSQNDFFINNNNNSKNTHDSNRFSFQTSSIYLNDDDESQQEKEKFTKIEPNVFWQTVDNLLRETEDIYNEICLINSKLEIDPFDNFSIQLEDTIWEDDKNHLSVYPYSNPILFQEGTDKTTVGNNRSHKYEYECLNEILDLYIQEEEEEVGRNKTLLNLELPSYQISSGSTLVLNK